MRLPDDLDDPSQYCLMRKFGQMTILLAWYFRKTIMEYIIFQIFSFSPTIFDIITGRGEK